MSSPAGNQEEGRPATPVSAPPTASTPGAENARKFAQQLLTQQLAGPGPFPPKKPTENAPITNSGPGAVNQQTPKSLKEALKGANSNAAENEAENAEKVAPGDKKADGSIAESDEVRYFYTQQKFWGGPTLSYTIYAILAVFPVTGFLGLDHMYMRSPGTGLTKCVFNFFSLGMWYFYDVIQAVKDKKDIYQYGVSMPLYGPSGIAAGSFIDPDAEEEEKAENKNGANGAATGSNAAVAPGANASGANASGANASGANASGANGTPVVKPVNERGNAGITQNGGAGGAGGAGGEEEGKKATGSAISFMLYSFATFFIPFGFEYLAAGDFKGFVAKFLLTFIGIGLVIGLLNIIDLISHPEKVLCKGTSRKLMPFIADEFKEAYFIKEGCGDDSGKSSGGWFSGLFENLIRKVPILKDIYAITTEVASAAGEGVKSLKQGATLVTGVASAAASLKGGAAQNQHVGIVQKPAIQQLGGAAATDGFSGTILSFTLALVFIGAAFLKGKDFVEAAANRTTERPAELGKYLWRKKNVNDLPPAAPEPGIL
jgi:hypothetical protein